MQTSNKQPSNSKRTPPPATTLEAREAQMIALAFDQAELELRNKTASSQVVSHYLKLGTMRAQAELEALKENNKLIVAKTEALQSTKRIEELYKEALGAMKSYSGATPGGEDDD